MKIFINNQEADITLDTEKILQDVLNGIQVECEKMNATIIGIEVDGNVILANKIDEVSSLEIDSVNELKISTVCKDDIVFSLKSMEKNFISLENDFADIGVKLQTGKDKEVHKTVEFFADSFDEFCHIVTLSALFPEDFSDLKIEDKSIAEFFESFSPILEDFNTALAENDTVLIGDLAEYEILPKISELKDFCANIN